MDFFYRHIGKLAAGALFGVLLLILFAAFASAERDIKGRCAQIMALARSSADSMQALMACEQIRADFNRDIAIISAGAAMGAAAGSRR